MPDPVSQPIRQSAPSRLSRWVAYLASGEFNPVFVKEMRQAVRGRMVLSMFLLALMVMFGVSAWMLLTMDANAPGFGSQMFAALLGTLTLLTAVCVPAWSGGRLLQERHGEEGIDLLYYTPMSTEEIVHGKLLSNVTLAAVFFAAGAPFLAITPMLRGVDAPTVIMVTGLHFLTVVFLAQGGVVLASLPVSRVWKGVIGLGVGLFAVPLVTFWLVLCTGYVFDKDALGMPLVYFFPSVLILGFLGLNILIVSAASYLAPTNGIYFRRDRPPRYWTPPPTKSAPRI